MWIAGIFAAVAFAGILFLLWFLVQLLREQPFQSRQIQLIRSLDYAALNPLQLHSEWAVVKRDSHALTLHSIWRYGVNQTLQVEKGGPSCGISSSY